MISYERDQGQIFKSDEPGGLYGNEHNSANQEGHFFVEDDVDENRKEGYKEVVDGDRYEDVFEDYVQFLHVEFQ